jgi:hypothetical protein
MAWPGIKKDWLYEAESQRAIFDESQKQYMRIKFILIFFMLAACSGYKTEQDQVTSSDISDAKPDTVIAGSVPIDYDAMLKLETYLSSEKDTSVLQEITESVALLILPTTEQVEALEAEYGEDFYTIADDASYYQSMASTMIDSLGVKSIDASKPFVRFVGRDSVYTLDIRKQGLPEWNIIFFNTAKAPEIIPAIELTEEKIKTYFDLDK